MELLKELTGHKTLTAEETVRQKTCAVAFETPLSNSNRNFSRLTADRSNAGFEIDTLHKQLNDLGYFVTKNELLANLTYLKEDGFVENPQFNAGNFYDGLSNEFYKLIASKVSLSTSRPSLMALVIMSINRLNATVEVF